MRQYCEQGVVSKVERYPLHVRSHEETSVLMPHKVAIRESFAALCDVIG